jgi:hypothetical protein
MTRRRGPKAMSMVKKRLQFPTELYERFTNDGYKTAKITFSLQGLAS